MNASIISGFLSGLILGVIVSYFWFKSQRKDNMTQLFEEKLNDILPKITQMAGDQTALIAKEKLESSSKEVAKELESKKELIDETLKRIHQNLDETNKRMEKAEYNRIGSFNTLTEQLAAQKEQVSAMRSSAESLSRVLSNNQTRGAFGEQIAEDLLKMAGFSYGVDYDKQKEERESRPDYTIRLPNGMKINVDVKFPYQNLQASSQTDDKAQKQNLLKEFEKDVRKKIKDLTTRDYISPADNTVDFVILFVPNESIFSYIYEKMFEVWKDGMKSKVILAGPFSFTAILSMVRQSYESFHIQSNILSIIKDIKMFTNEYQKQREVFTKLGAQLNTVQGTYESLRTTRDNTLQKAIDRINNNDKVGLFETISTTPLLEESE